jgi:integrase
VLVASYGGLRIGELAGLRPHRIDLDRGRVDIAEIAVEVRGEVVWGAPKTRAGRRSVSLPGPVVDELRDHLAAHAGRDLVFPGPGGRTPLRTPTWRRRVWQPAVDAAGLAPLRPHDLRHTAVALWIAVGANVLEVARRAGHTSSAFTMDRYGHLFPEADQALSDRLAALYEGHGRRVEFDHVGR